MRNDSTVQDVTVWVADGQATPELDYGTRLCREFSEVGAQVERHDLTAVRGDEPLKAGIHVLSGGITSVNDAESWMPEAKKLVTRMIHHAEGGESQLLGVCLGSQIIADCLAPGAIVRGADITAGLIEVDWSMEEAAGDDLNVLPAFHFEQIHPAAAERAGVEVVASSPSTPVLAFRYGPRVAGIQLHPELGAAEVLELLQYNGDVIVNHAGDLPQITRHSQELADRVFPLALPRVTSRLLGTDFAV